MSSFIRTLVQLPGETEPQPHYALIFDDVVKPIDFTTYRNALMDAAKAIMSINDLGPLQNDVYWLLQIAELISSALDQEIVRNDNDQAENPLDVYMRHIAHANNIILEENLTPKQ